MQQIRAHFGTPNQIAAACVDDMETAELLHTMRTRKKITTAVVAGVLAALTMWGAYLGWAVHEYSQSINGYGETYVTTFNTDSNAE